MIENKAGSNLGKPPCPMEYKLYLFICAYICVYTYVYTHICIYMYITVYMCVISGALFLLGLGFFEHN